MERMARTEDAIKRPRLGWDTRTVGRAWPSGGKVKDPEGGSELINSVCGHAVCIHAVGKNAVYAGSFKPTRVVINAGDCSSGNLKLPRGGISLQTINNV